MAALTEMRPSLLAREIQNGLKHCLRTGFEPSDPLFAGVMRRFTALHGHFLRRMLKVRFDNEFG